MSSTSEIAGSFWSKPQDRSPDAFGVYAMGRGGRAEIMYRHYFEVRHFVRLAALSSESAVLELGCGNGRWAVALAPMVQRYVGVDLSPQGIAFAEAALRAHGITNAALILSSITDFNAAGPFDRVYFSGVSQYLEDHELLAVLDRLRPLCPPQALVIDRSTVSLRARAVFKRGDYQAIFRTGPELAEIFASRGFILQHQARSHRFLRLSRLFTLPLAGRILTRLAAWTRPASLHAMAGMSALADALRPAPYEGGATSHDFFVFRSSTAGHPQ